MVYKPTNITGGPHPVVYGGFKPSEKYESQIGSSSQLLGKIKNVPNHQPAMVYGGYNYNSSVGFINQSSHHRVAPSIHIPNPAIRVIKHTRRKRETNDVC